MPEQFTVSCIKKHNLDFTIIGNELKFTREFDGDWNCCSDHSHINIDMMLGKNCMKCGHLKVEAV